MSWPVCHGTLFQKQQVHPVAAVMPLRMIQSRTKIVTPITGGKSERWIARETDHGRDLIREVRPSLYSSGDLFALKHLHGVPELFSMGRYGKDRRSKIGLPDSTHST
jgi:hypothetical protein